MNTVPCHRRGRLCSADKSLLVAELPRRNIAQLFPHALNCTPCGLVPWTKAAENPNGEGWPWSRRVNKDAYASESGSLRLSNYNLPKFPVRDAAVKCSLANLPLSCTLSRIHFTEFKINHLPDGAVAEVNIWNCTQSFLFPRKWTKWMSDFFFLFGGEDTMNRNIFFLCVPLKSEGQV